MSKIINEKVLTINGDKYLISTYDNGAISKKRLVEKKDEIEDIASEIIDDCLSQEEIQAQILLNQAEILTNQNAQDEVLAEVLLNSLEV